MKIAISGKSGCGNSSVSRLVAEKLGLRCINYTFRSAAAERGMTFEALRALAEVYPEVDRSLDRRQRTLAEGGNCVIGSRLAVWIIDDADLRVFLVASLEMRAQRIAKRERRSLDEVYRATDKRDRQDQARYRHLYTIDTNDYSFVEMVIDVERPTAAEVAERIVRRARTL